MKSKPLDAVAVACMGLADSLLVEGGPVAPADFAVAGAFFLLREIELTMWEGQYRTALRDSTGQSDAQRWAEWKQHPASFTFAEDGHAPLAT